MPVAKPVIGVDGTVMKKIPVPAGTPVFLGILASNLNKDIWGEDALEWKPERWLTPLPAKVHEARIPSIYSNLCAPHSC